MLMLLGVGIIVVLGIIIFKYLDCDLTLLWNLKYGKQPNCLAGKVVWITGCSSGIGEGLAYEFASAGCRLVLSARRENLLKEVKQKCIEISTLTADDILVQPLDLLDFSSHPSVAETVIKYFKKVDILVNNAGRSQRGLIVETALEVDRQVFELDLLAPISVTKAILPYMIKQRQGHIMCTSSVAGKLGAPGSGTYSAAKHGIQGFFDTLRIECAPDNIGVTMACPGPVFSDALVHAFTSEPDKKLNVEMQKSWNRMTARRCAYLMVVAAANKLHEAWLTPNPELFYCYLFQYTPYIAKKIAVKLGQGRANKVKAGIANLH
ncbi:dehydrogenase/reductase SDR family member 7-like [Mercenaria mercenaria]|uniref:dehydrogenase/reductase SDR family member 7-like n=1 Tax=Mercenaria mercenaria TaxID=6596 RepID=UPI00234F8D08|nr:dehydrogenase/reductase SDR family member 7-like [Mercenaria mercenaria]XP_045184863.2 dehydrogenase/reductase SDR family member 7-like [Mercenaria mercenaria]XP_053399005.1 dehydrogenase/reductase SDR family member 7-like [Mercenaria mercenaria]